MKRGTHIEHHGSLGATPPRKLHRTRHRSNMPRNHNLARAIKIGWRNDLPLRGLPTDLLRSGLPDPQEGSHGALARGYRFLHILAALADQLNGIAKAQGSSDHERRIFAKTVTRHKGGAEDLLTQDFCGGN
jgi:hypothetical protein